MLLVLCFQPTLPHLVGSREKKAVKYVFGALLLCFVPSLQLPTTGSLHCRKRWSGLRKRAPTSWSPVGRLVCVCGGVIAEPECLLWNTVYFLVSHPSPTVDWRNSRWVLCRGNRWALATGNPAWPQGWSRELPQLTAHWARCRDRREGHLL